MSAPRGIASRKSVESILSPIPKPFIHLDKEYSILPMTDGVLMTITDAISEVVAILDTVAKLSMPEGQRPVLTPGLMLPVLPQILKALLPKSTTIIAAGLGVDESWVSSNLRIAKRLEALRLILEAEDIGLIMENFNLLVKTFPGPKPAEIESIEPGSTSSSPQNTDGK